MAVIPTGFLGALGGALSKLGGAAVGALGGLATKLVPYAGLGLSAYQLYAGTKSPTPGAVALPGGAPISPMYTTGLESPMLPAPSSGGWGGVPYAAGQGPMTNGGGGGYRAPRMARQVQVTAPNGAIRTYVLAPMVRYRVSISPRRRRYSGGR